MSIFNFLISSIAERDGAIKRRQAEIAQLEACLTQEREHRMTYQVMYLSAAKSLREANRGIARLVKRVKRLKAKGTK